MTRSLVLHGVRNGTFVVVRRNSRTGQKLFSRTLTRGQVKIFDGTHFYVHAYRPAGVRITHSVGVTVLGG
jgi:hypothetical protein